MNEVEKDVNPQLWHACAGGLVQMPSPNSNVYYFPQGHAEHALSNVDFTRIPRVPAFILCRVIDVKFQADLETDVVYAKIRLIPLVNSDISYNSDVEDVTSESGFDSSENPSCFAKTLTQSDANNGGGFSVPRYCAETLFPRLDYSVDPPVQTVVAKDVHGEIWKFRHIYRGTPKRHLLTTGWSTFVNHKRLVAGDSIVFVRTDNGDLCVGIRRAKRGGISGSNSQSGWNFYSGNVYYSLRGKVKPEDVIEATSLAANGQPFDVVYYPRANMPDFCVKASSLTASLNRQWCAGMRFKMAFETEDSSRISWFMGTVFSVEVVDPFNWPNSPWRFLKVSWDEPDLLQSVKRVNPWLVEVVSNIHHSPFSPQRKKLRLPQPPDLPRAHHPLTSFSVASFSSIQGARHARFEIPFRDLNLNNHKLQLGVFPTSFNQLDSHAYDGNDDVSCLLTMGTASSLKLDKSDETLNPPLFLLFGQPIHVDQQQQISSDNDSNCPVNTNHFKVFLESEDDVESYEQLKGTFGNLKVNNSEFKGISDESFSEFVREE